MMMPHDVEHYKVTIKMAVARRRRCDAVLAGGGDDRKDDMGKEEKDGMMNYDSWVESIEESGSMPDTMKLNTVNKSLNGVGNNIVSSAWPNQTYSPIYWLIVCRYNFSANRRAVNLSALASF